MVFSRCFFHMVCARAARLTLVGCTVSVRVCVWARSRNVRRAKFDTWQRSRSCGLCLWSCSCVRRRARCGVRPAVCSRERMKYMRALRSLLLASAARAYLLVAQPQSSSTATMQRPVDAHRLPTAHHHHSTRECIRALMPVRQQLGDMSGLHARQTFP